MFRRLRRALIALGLLAVPLLYIGCGAPAGPPSPPVEVPSPVVLKFVEPADLSIDFGSISKVTTDPAGNLAVKVVNPGDDVTELIQFGPGFLDAIDGAFIAPSFRSISELQVPLDATITTFSDTVTFSAGADFLAGTHEVKLSFADFDFDDDGATEGCSGGTGSTPICVRFWLDGERYLAWVFDELARDDDPATAENEATVGRGRFKVYADDVNGFQVAFLISYAQDAATETLTVEQSMREVNVNKVECPGVEICYPIVAIDWHFVQQQIGPPASAFKNLNYNTHFVIEETPDNYAGEGDLAYLGQFVEGSDFWSGSVFRDGVGDFAPIDESDVCASISRFPTFFVGTAVTPETCEDIAGTDIRVRTTAFVDPFDPADVAVPTGFPAAPPF